MFFSIQHNTCFKIGLKPLFHNSPSIVTKLTQPSYPNTRTALNQTKTRKPINYEALTVGFTLPIVIGFLNFAPYFCRRKYVGIRPKVQIIACAENDQVYPLSTTQVLMNQGSMNADNLRGVSM